MSEQPHPTEPTGAPQGQPTPGVPTPDGGSGEKQTGQSETGGALDLQSFEKLLQGAGPDTKLEVTRAVLEKYLQSETDRTVAKALKTREATLREKLTSEIRAQVQSEIEQELQKKITDEKAPIEERLRAREMETAKLSAELTSVQEELKTLTDALSVAITAFSENLPKDLRAEIENESLSMPQRLRLAVALSKHMNASGFGGKPSLRGTSTDIDIDAILQKVTPGKPVNTQELPAYPRAWKRAGV